MPRKTTGYLFQRSGVWYLQWRLRGKTFSQTTGERDRKKAEAVRDRILAPIKLQDKADGLRLMAARVIDADKDAAEAAKESIPWREVWRVYHASADRGDQAQSTMTMYYSHLTMLMDWAVDQGIAEPALLTMQHAKQYAGHLTDTGLTGSTHNKHISFLAALWRVLDLPADVWASVRRRRHTAQSRRELTLDEFRKVIATATGELRTLLIIGAYTGLRLSDCCALGWADVVGGVIVKIPSKTRRTGKPVRIPVHPDLQAELDRVPLPHDGLIVPGMAAAHARAAYNVTRPVQTHLTECGITTTETVNGRESVRVGFHSLRHTFVSLCRAADVPLSVVEAIVGHSSPAMTRHYTHTGDAAAAAAVATLPGLVDGPAKRAAIPEWVRAELQKQTAETWQTIRDEMLKAR